MSRENTKARNKLIEKYGEVCFIEELKIRKPEEIEKERQLKYTGNKQLAICDQLTYHHIVEKYRGGKATEENGALLRYINHQWFNRLSKEQQKVINAMFQQYKREHSKEVPVEYVDNLSVDFHINAFIFTPDLIKHKKQYNRTKKKKEDKKIIEEWEERNDE